MLINTEISSYKERNGAVTGIIYLIIDGKPFPDPVWSDFVIRILGWWCEDYIKLLSSSTETQWTFMDGPFQLTISKVSQDEVVLKAEERRLSGIQILSQEVSDIMDVYSELRKTINKVLREVDYTGNDDFDKLKSLYQSFTSTR